MKKEKKKIHPKAEIKVIKNILSDDEIRFRRLEIQIESLEKRIKKIEDGRFSFKNLLGKDIKLR